MTHTRLLGMAGWGALILIFVPPAATAQNLCLIGAPNGNAIKNVSPSLITAGRGAFTLSVETLGVNVGPLSIVRWNGQELPNKLYYEQTQTSCRTLTATVSSSMVASPGSAQIEICYIPAVEQPYSCSAPAAVTIRPAPSITSLSPSSAVVGGPTFDLAVNGQNFYSGDRVLFDGEILLTGFSSSSLLSASVPSFYLGYARPATVSILTVDYWTAADTVYQITNPITATVTTNPVGRQVTVDGTPYTTTATTPTFQWAPGSPHTISVSSPQGSAGTQFTFQGWSDGGPASHTVSPVAATTYTASFSTSYQLTTEVLPSAAAGSLNQPNGSYHAANTNIQVTANANSGYVFNNWSFDASGTSNPVSVFMNGPKTVKANFGPAPAGITVTTIPTGRQVIVDGTPYTSPTPPLQWTPGTEHTIEVPTQPETAGTRYTFLNWTDGGAASRTVTAPSTNTTYTANFSISYRLTTEVLPSAAGLVTPASGTYHPAGLPIQVTATANSGYAFTSWSGALSGTTSSQQLMMDAPKSVTANFVSSNVTPSPTSLTFNGGVGGAGGLAVAPQGLTVTSSLPYTVSTGGTSWLSVTPTSGPGPHSVSIVNYTGLSAGTFSGSITITNPAGNSSVPVTLTVVSCVPTLQPTSHTAGPAAGTASFTAAFNPQMCIAKLDQPNSSWLSGNAISIPTGLRVDFAVGANTGAQRSGILRVNQSADFAVTQSNSPTPCAMESSATPTAFPATGGTGSVTVTVTAGTGCSWTGSPGASWISFPSGAAGTGNGSFAFSVESNPGSLPRAGTIVVNGQTITIQQSGGGTSCLVTLAPGSATVAPAGGNGDIIVGGSCNWNVENSSSFVTIQSGPQGTGPGTVRYIVPAYSGPNPRSAVVTIGGRSFRLTQNGVACTFQMSPVTVSAPAGASLQSVALRTAPGCGWNASTSAGWITIVSGANGSADGRLVLSLATNTGAQRSEVVTVAGQSVLVTQESGSNCPVTLDATAATFESTGSPEARIRVNATCPWTVVSNATFVSVLSGLNGNGNGTVLYSVQAGQAARQGTLNIGGRTFTIRQLPPTCEYSLSNIRGTIPAEGGEVGVRVTASSEQCLPVPSGTSPAWVTQRILASASREVTLGLRATPNPGVKREETWKIGDHNFTLTQTGQGEFACSLRPPSPTQVRAEGRTELASDLVLDCSGASRSAMTGDVLVKFNTNFTSKPAGSATEALLLVGNPAAPQPSVNAFQGIVASNDAVRFLSVPLAASGANATRTFRMTNLRLDASLPNLPEMLTATVMVIAPFRNIVVQNDSQAVARRVTSLQTTIGPAQPVSGGVRVPVTFRELIPNAFRSRDGEGGYRNATSLGPELGYADSGTRLVVKLRSLSFDARVSAPLYPDSGQSAQLVPDDPNGAGTGFRTAAAPGNPLVEIPVVDGEATLAWEILSANPSSVEEHTFTIFLTDGSNLAARLSASLGSLASATTIRKPVPSFIDPAAPIYSMPTIRLRTRVESITEAMESSARRAPAGNISAIVSTSATCDSPGGCDNARATGNSSAGSSFTNCDSEASCSGSGKSAEVSSPKLGQGQRMDAKFQTDITPDASGGSFVSSRFGSHGSDSEDAACFIRTDPFPALSFSGGTGTFRVYGCSNWYISSSVSWITFDPIYGEGEQEIRYTVHPNLTGTSRTGNVTFSSGLQPPIRVTQSGPSVPGNGLRFVPVTPCRLLETRTAYAGTTWTGAYGPPLLTSAAPRKLPIAGNPRCNIPATAKAFALNITVDTVANNTGPVDQVTVYPSGQARPAFATIRTSTGGYIANSAIVAAGADGAVDIAVSSSAHVLVDINGFFTDTGDGLLFYPFTPCRAVDTRGAPYGLLPAPYGNSRLQAQQPRAFRLPGSPGCQNLPAAAAYSLQMTLVPGTHSSGAPVAYVTAYPSGPNTPGISNTNSLSGYVVANSAIVPASSNGTIDVVAYNATNLILDVNGYFAADDGSGRGLAYFPVPQCRVLSTVGSTHQGSFGPPALTPTADRTIQVGGGACGGIPSTARAFALNAWVQPNGLSMPYLTLWPAGLPWPNISQLNAFEGQTVANSAIVPASFGQPGVPDGSIHIRVANQTNVGLEVAGYFARP